MKPLKNDRFLRAIWREPIDRTPIWIMRQAGRYLPEYRKVREKAGSFLTLCKTPELACEVTLQPLRRFPLDAAILFSDILTIPDAMGLGLYFQEGEGPAFERPVQNAKAVEMLVVPEPEAELSYVLDAVRLIHHELAGRIPLIGFCGSPWTIATYMVEGKANKAFPLIQKMLQEAPHILHQLLDKLTTAVTVHLNAQIRAGVQAVMLFDTWGGMLDTINYETFSLFYMEKIISQLITQQEGERIPVILFTKGGGLWLERLARSGCHVVGLDATVNLKKARERIGHKVALQGNLEPACLLAGPDKIQKEVARILAEFGRGSGHIFNLGHGITPDVHPDNVSVLIEAVQTLSRPYHL